MPAWPLHLPALGADLLVFSNRILAEAKYP
jgi:hypothetical protein